MFAISCLMLSCLTSCGSAPGPKIKKVPVVPVKGIVTVDGQPEGGVKIDCIPQGNFEHKDIAKSMTATTNDKGEFALSTYAIGDGVPAGDYALTFIWPEFTLSKKQEKKDTVKQERLKGKYAKPEGSPRKFKVEKSPVVLEPVDLSTK